MKRREFLKVAGAASAGAMAHGAIAQAGRGCTIVIDGSDPIAGAPPVQWAAEQLRAALAAKGALCRIVISGAGSSERVRGSAFYVLVNSAATSSVPVPGGKAPASPASAGKTQAGQKSAGVASAGLKSTGLVSTESASHLPAWHPGAESFALTPGRYAVIPATIVSGNDVRGCVYGLLEIAERVRFAADARTALHLAEPILEKPANEVRSVGRYFCSEVEDKAWLYDKDFWLGYLDLLIASRFNRFCLAFGLEYDFPKGVTSDYLHFPYPYLVNVPGYDVRVMQLAAADGTVLPAPVELSDRERKMNLDALKFIAAQTAARGMHFQLGIWTHAYQWTDSPNAYHRIEGLTSATHAEYCRDALAMLLSECPEIQGLTLRVHGESGIPEGSYGFWRTLFEAIKDCGRTVEIDMHAKGVDETMIDIAKATGMPVKLGAKYSAEHQSLGYQQADIRALEIPTAVHEALGPFAVSSGARSFTRYGYADFLRAGSPYKLLFRLWPGTQRHLLSADPEMAAAYGRTAHFCGAVGLDLMEPLTFKGREGSGHAGGRYAYADASLNTKADWEKFEFYYRVWGRRLYDPDANAEAWRRWLRSQFGTAATAVETAVANASRILPLLTSAHLPSASNHSFWPEMYTNMPIVRASGELSPYSDTPEPRCFGTVSPLDPQLFATIDEHVADEMGGSANPKYSPIEVAQWIEDCATAASTALDEARRKTVARRTAAFRRVEADVEIQIGLGWFFASKLRGGVLYSIFEQSQETEAGRKAIDAYSGAREAWAGMAAKAAAIYQADVSYGSTPMRRGHWSDRLSAIDKDIEAVVERVKGVERPDVSSLDTRHAIGEATGAPGRPELACDHKSPASFEAGAPLTLALTVLVPDEVTSIRLHYRHVDQAERWKRVEMRGDGGSFTAAIPADYMKADFPLEYYFDLVGKSGASQMEPAFNATLSNQPYYTVATVP
jgi:hypothetical protein